MKYKNKLDEIKSISTNLLLNSSYGNIITEQQRLNDTFTSTLDKIYTISKQPFSIQQSKPLIKKIFSSLTQQELKYFKDRFPEIIRIITINELNTNDNEHSKNKREYTFDTFKSLCEFGISPEQYKEGDSEWLSNQRSTTQLKSQWSI